MDKKTKMFIIPKNQAFDHLVTVVQTQEKCSILIHPELERYVVFLLV